MSLKIAILTENAAGGTFLAEHGLSYYIEFEGQKTLFDTGHSNVFLKNAIKLNIDINKEVDTIVLSHGHWDHGDGLRFIENKTLITHPSAFIKRYRKNDNSYIGLTLSKEEIEKKFHLILSEVPYKLSDNLYYLGTIPRINGFEALTTPFIKEDGKPDFVPDDSALAAVQNNELIVITGCSHAGICNIIEYTKRITGINKVKAVIGGFHLKFKNNQTSMTINYLKNQDIEQIYPTHCTQLPALAAFYEAFKIKHITTGTVLDF